MKIAVESNDGENIKSPFDETRGYLVFEVINDTVEETKYYKLRKATAFSKVLSLSGCKTIITRGMYKEKREQFIDQGFDVFVTFNTSARDALDSYIKENIINHPELV